MLRNCSFMFVTSYNVAIFMTNQMSFIASLTAAWREKCFTGCVVAHHYPLIWFSFCQFVLANQRCCHLLPLYLSQSEIMFHKQYECAIISHTNLNFEHARKKSKDKNCSFGSNQKVLVSHFSPLCSNTRYVLESQHHFTSWCEFCTGFVFAALLPGELRP